MTRHALNNCAKVRFHLPNLAAVLQRHVPRMQMGRAAPGERLGRHPAPRLVCRAECWHRWLGCHLAAQDWPAPTPRWQQRLSTLQDPKDLSPPTRACVSARLMTCSTTRTSLSATIPAVRGRGGDVKSGCAGLQRGGRLRGWRRYSLTSECDECTRARNASFPVYCRVSRWLRCVSNTITTPAPPHCCWRTRCAGSTLLAT